MKWQLAHKAAPPAGELVHAILMNEDRGLQEVLLRRVGEGECDWHVVGERAEQPLDLDWEVIGWRAADPADITGEGLIPAQVVDQRWTIWEAAIAAGLSTWISTPFTAIGGRKHLIAIYNAMRKRAPQR